MVQKLPCGDEREIERKEISSRSLCKDERVKQKRAIARANRANKLLNILNQVNQRVIDYKRLAEKANAASAITSDT